jgi:CubicO group peptidase (beta-lactamase class C family)
MKLHEDGFLNIKDKVFAQNGPLDIPQFSDNIKDKRVRNITIEDLLRHKGGFSSRYGDPLFNLPIILNRTKIDTTLTTDQIISYSLSQRLAYNPGTTTRYSNLGYLILSRLIEQVTQKTYEEYIKEHILKPIGIFDMHLAYNLYEERYENEVKYYEPFGSEPIRTFDGSDNYLPRSYGGNNIRGLMGAGGWVASSPELLKLVAAIDGRDTIPDILSKESINIMTNYSPSNLPIGWSRCTPGGDWTRTGNLAGSSAIIKYNRDGYSWVFITNTSSWKGAKFPPEIAQMIRRASHKIEEWPDRDLFNPKS